MSVQGWHRPSRDEDLTSCLPRSPARHQRTRDRQCGAHMGASQGFSVKTCFLAGFCPIRPGSPAPSWDHREAEPIENSCEYTQLLKVGPGSSQFPFFPPWGYSDLQQISSHCHSGVVLIIFLGLCRFNSSPTTFLYKLGVNPSPLPNSSLAINISPSLHLHLSSQHLVQPNTANISPLSLRT